MVNAGGPHEINAALGIIDILEPIFASFLMKHRVVALILGAMGMWIVGMVAAQWLVVFGSRV